MSFKDDVERVKEIWSELEEAGRLYAVWLEEEGASYGIVDVNEEGLFCVGWVYEISQDDLENMLGRGAELFESYEDALLEYRDYILDRIEV
ncbi:hypothetical protein CampHawk_217 [Bacillus phage CampHawk]|uniref:Uncharacterized protein n=1 Tax=Bacillus phage CampHawk TaxID=1406783 RepID=U5PT32_9CAUD|nr:hypothetical protein CampHawk_16 [Bacillus phage CampHawk]YP_008770151.1 hypothetical protein CampHawk_217 [Bacillus phage CampHawk]UNY48956.1 hypothetical protein sp82g_19 [Bacillus phage SP82G]WIT26748.1 hypothetical protein [Bacillus phage SPO1L5]AGY46894.1 hypothetical protein CampHawk_16 [Bacillus phage CampHawk]AGY47095.1 hypothetical protein CampHawk_217 [Bacillus phage CampHawk]